MQPIPQETDSYRVSISQVESAFEPDGCLCKWGLRYLDGIKRPDTSSTIFGNELHSTLASYLSTGEPIDYLSRTGPQAWGMIPHLPVPMLPGMRVEQPINLDLPAPEGMRLPPTGVPWTLTPDYWIPAAHTATGKPFLGDHKSTSDPKLYAKTSAYLATRDIQSNFYGWALLAIDGATEIDCRWIYARSKVKSSPQIEVRDFRLHMDHCSPMAHAIHVRGSYLYQLRLSRKDGLRGNHLPKNPAACYAFGPCFYMDQHCQRTVDQISLASLIKARRDNERREKLELAAAGKLPV